MAKFNTVVHGTTKTKNHEGAEAYTMDAKMELYSAVVTSSLSNKFYEKSDENLARIQKLIKTISEKDPSFVAKLAVYAREQMYLRSIPLVLVTELAKNHNGDDIVSKAVGRVIQRADEITELLSYYTLANERKDTKKLGKLSKQVKKGLSIAFNKFNEYGFSKYNRDGAIKLRDALFIAHPKAKNEAQQVLFDKIANGTLETAFTWETQLSKGEDKKETWEKLIDSGNLGYMALLRNLRNILEAQVSPKHIGLVAEILSNEEQVKKSKQFPFRFLSAYREIKPVLSGKASMILDALEEAMIDSAKNISGFNYETSVLVSVDTSGSMESKVSDRSKISYMDVGLVLGMLLHNQCKDVETSIWGTGYKTINLPKKNILANAETLHKYSNEVGSCTNGHLIFEDLIKRKEVKDKVMVFTDLQLWDSNDYSYYSGFNKFAPMWKEYKKIAPNCKLYLFDLAGYGTTPISLREDGVILIAGWSDKIFDMLEAIENGSSALKEIEKIVL